MAPKSIRYDDPADVVSFACDRKLPDSQKDIAIREMRLFRNEHFVYSLFLLKLITVIFTSTQNLQPVYQLILYQ